MNTINEILNTILPHSAIIPIITIIISVLINFLFTIFSLSHDAKLTKIRTIKFIFALHLLERENNSSYLKKRIEKELKINRKNENRTICDELKLYKEKQSKKAKKTLYILIIFYPVLNYLLKFNINIDFNITVVTMILIILINIENFLVEYRIKKGYYGTNYFEAKELLNYIKKNDNQNTHKGKKIFSDTKDSSIIIGNFERVDV